MVELDKVYLDVKTNTDNNVKYEQDWKLNKSIHSTND